jgi:hypothetical protein
MMLVATYLFPRKHDTALQAGEDWDVDERYSYGWLNNQNLAAGRIITDT